MNVKSMIQRIYSFLIDANIIVLIVVPVVVGLIVFGMMFVIWPNGYNGTHTQGLWISLGWFCFGLSSIPKIVRRESFFGPVRYRGPLAVIDGILTLVLFWALASIPLIVWNR